MFKIMQFELVKPCGGQVQHHSLDVPVWFHPLRVMVQAPCEAYGSTGCCSISAHVITDADGGITATRRLAVTMVPENVAIGAYPGAFLGTIHCDTDYHVFLKWADTDVWELPIHALPPTDLCDQPKKEVNDESDRL